MKNKTVKRVKVSKEEAEMLGIVRWLAEHGFEELAKSLMLASYQIKAPRGRTKC